MPIFPQQHAVKPSIKLALILALGGLASAACDSSGDRAESAATDEVLFVNTGDNCRNFLIIAPVTEENARKFVPAEFTLTQPPTAFVELADCPAGSINGVASGPFRIAEAAVFITPPDGDSFPPVVGANSAIYLLWQLDSNAELSRLKREAGFFGELVPGIELNVSTGTLPITASGFANVPYTFSPYQLSATLTPDSPQAVPLPNGLWHVGPKGVVTTFNDIFETQQILAGVGTITLQEGTALEGLFGSTSVIGVAAAGIGSFVNTTRLRPDIAAQPVVIAR